MSNQESSQDPKIVKRAAFRFGLKNLLGFVLVCAIFCGLLQRWQAVGLIVFVLVATPIAIARWRGTAPELLVLKWLVVYLSASIITMPFLNSWWWGEIPVLAIFQVPKTAFANYLRTIMVTKLLGRLGLSQGSFSPDWTMARPYALAVAYVIFLSVVVLILWFRTKMAPPYRLWLCLLLLLSAIDYCFTLAYTGGPGLSLY